MWAFHHFSRFTELNCKFCVSYSFSLLFRNNVTWLVLLEIVRVENCNLIIKSHELLNNYGCVIGFFLRIKVHFWYNQEETTAVSETYLKSLFSVQDINCTFELGFLQYGNEFFMFSRKLSTYQRELLQCQTCVYRCRFLYF